MLDNIVRVTNPERLKEYVEACQLCKKAFDTRVIKIECETNEPLVSTGNIAIIGKEISIRDKDAFARICMLASNWEVYPFRGNNVQMTFMFYNLTIPVQ